MDYILSSANTRLIPVQPEHASDIILYANDESVRRISTFYSSMLNLAETRIETLAKKLKENQDNCIMFRVESGDKLGRSPFIGLYDINRNQGRCFMAFFCTDTDLKQKILYEPVKLLCVRAFSEWCMDRLYTIVEAADRATMTMLKGFGFKETITLEGYASWKGDPVDVQILVCNKNNFRSFNAAD